MLFLGIALGISGNLVANIMDRYFLAHFGLGYDIFALLFFGVIIWYLNRKFTQKLGN